MRILLCEDEQDLSRAVKEMLQRSGYSVDAVYNGADALSYISAENYDAVILDIMMPKMNGLDVLKKTREAKNNIPIIMLTAKTQIDDKVVGLDLGANDYLTKPFSMKELLARIRVLTRPSERAQTSVLNMGNVSLNRSNLELSTKDSSFRLANKEFQMMEILMANKNNVVSSDILFDKIWGYDTDVEMNIVWVYISYLRKKLTSMNANIIISAVRGVGYQLMLEE